jgi:hypothetical protein
LFHLCNVLQHLRIKRLQVSVRVALQLLQLRRLGGAQATGKPFPNEYQSAPIGSWPGALLHGVAKYLEGELLNRHLAGVRLELQLKRQGDPLR